MPNYSEEIKKTGFILENSISRQLKNNNWNIISNKYYEDDVEESIREIDILAYKVTQINDFHLYTALIISCKKSEENAWALISRDINLEEPNSNWWPLHVWSNDTVINQILNIEGINKEYYNFMHLENEINIMQPPAVDIFAFQQMNKSNGKPQNDKNIFSSITTLMKAQSYEMSALKSRIRKKCIYQFNLLSIIDSDLIKLHINEDDTISQQSIDSEQIIARYIINKKDDFYRIRFITSNAFKDYINSFDKLHTGNIKLFNSKRELWLTNSVSDFRKIQILKNDFIDEIVNYIVDASEWNITEREVKNSAFLVYNNSKIRIFISDNEVINQRLNSNIILQERTKYYLQKIFRYTGEYYYSSDSLPF